MAAVWDPSRDQVCDFREWASWVQDRVQVWDRAVLWVWDPTPDEVKASELFLWASESFLWASESFLWAWETCGFHEAEATWRHFSFLEPVEVQVSSVSSKTALKTLTFNQFT
jgi:hypothetical protein